MKLYQPQVQLAKRVHIDGPNEYWLHSVIFCDQTRYIAAGHAPVPTEPDANRVLPVTLFIAQDLERPDLNFLTPVVHSIYLGRFDLDILVQVTAKEVSRGTSNGGSTTVSSTSASEKDKPIRSLDS